MTNDQEKQFFRENRFLLKGRIFFPALLKPKPNKEGTKTNYNVQFAWKPEENAEVHAKLGAFLSQAYNTFYPGFPIQNWVNPVKRFDTYVRMDGKPNAEYLRGLCWVNAATGIEVPPYVCMQGPVPGSFIQLRSPDHDAEEYSGRNAVMEISFYRIQKNKHGLSTNVNTVLLLPGGEREGGFSAPDLNKLFGGFASDMGMAAPVMQNPLAGYAGNAAPQGTPQGGAIHPGAPTQGSPQGGYGQNAMNAASPSNWPPTGAPAQNTTPPPVPGGNTSFV